MMTSWRSMLERIDDDDNHQAPFSNNVVIPRLDFLTPANSEKHRSREVMSCQGKHIENDDMEKPPFENHVPHYEPRYPPCLSTVFPDDSGCLARRPHSSPARGPQSSATPQEHPSILTGSICRNRAPPTSNSVSSSGGASSASSAQDHLRLQQSEISSPMCRSVRQDADTVCHLCSCEHPIYVWALVLSKS